jgi:hypothetical protein
VIKPETRSTGLDYSSLETVPARSAMLRRYSISRRDSDETRRLSHAELMPTCNLLLQRLRD